jgi:flagella basal body P-ring formation protein FlgA
MIPAISLCIAASLSCVAPGAHAADALAPPTVAAAPPPAAPATVQRGQSVVLRHAMGHVMVKTSAQALQDGAPGQIVQVRANAQILRARVTGPGELELSR